MNLLLRGKGLLSQIWGRYFSSYFNFTSKSRIRDKVVVIPKIFNLKARVTEPWVLELLDRLLAESSGTFLDVGVNLGQILVKTKVCDPDRAYVGFEPNSACVYYLHELIRANGFRNCEIIPAALSDQDSLCSLEFYSDDPSGPAASIVTNFRGGVHSRTWVPQLRYETAARALELEEIGIVTIDVEGGELEVLQTLQPCLAEHRPLILLEILPAYSEGNADRIERQQAIERLLRELDFSLYRVHRSNGSLDLELITEVGIHSKMEWSVYVACPSERVSSLESRF